MICKWLSGKSSQAAMNLHDSNAEQDSILLKLICLANRLVKATSLGMTEGIRTTIMQIHRGLRRFFRQPFANHAKTNSYPRNTRNDAKEEEISGTTPAFAKASADAEAMA